MKNQELFDKTVGILVKAYQKNTLRHESCCACAVGNIIAANMGICEPFGWDHSWNEVFTTMGYLPHKRQEVYPKYYIEEAKKQIDSTGYSYTELARIENAFEMKYSRYTDPDGYLGLMSVVDCLMEIHEATKEEAQQAKELFTHA